jgi:hypothetical protein
MASDAIALRSYSTNFTVSFHPETSEYFPSVLQKYHARPPTFECNCAGTKSSNVSINTKMSTQLVKGKEQNVHVERINAAPAMFHVWFLRQRVLLCWLQSALDFYATQDALFPAGNALKDSETGRLFWCMCCLNTESMYRKKKGCSCVV